MKGVQQRGGKRFRHKGDEEEEEKEMETFRVSFQNLTEELLEKSCSLKTDPSLKTANLYSQRFILRK